MTAQRAPEPPVVAGGVPSGRAKRSAVRGTGGVFKPTEDGLSVLGRELQRRGAPQVPPQCLCVDVCRNVGGGAAGCSLEHHSAAAVCGPGQQRHRPLRPGRMRNAPPTAVHLHRVTTRDLVHGHVGRSLLQNGWQAPVALE